MSQEFRLDNLGILKLFINAADPITRRIFAILEPIIFPKDNSLALLKTASIETKSSHKDVPKPIIMIPINISDKLNFLPSIIAPEIKYSAPKMRINSPNKSSTKSIYIFITIGTNLFFFFIFNFS